MGVYKTEGIILKRIDVGEADKILTVFSKQRGKISVIAKGVRRVTSRKGGNLELLYHCVFYLAEGRNLDVLSDVSVIENFDEMRSNLVKIGYAYQIAEVLDKLTVEDQEAFTVFELLRETLETLNAATRRYELILTSFSIKLLSDLGFWSANDLKVTPSIKKTLLFLERASYSNVLRLRLEKRVSEEAVSFIESYVEYVIERKLVSKKFVRDIERHV